MTAPDHISQATRSFVAGLVLLSRRLFPWAGWPATAADVLTIFGAGKSQAYEVSGRVEALMPTLTGTPGRPISKPKPLDSSDQTPFTAVLKAFREYVYDHPGAPCCTGDRRSYTEGFRRFAVSMGDAGQPGEGLSVAELASALGVPLGTFKDWLRPQKAGDAPTSQSASASKCVPPKADAPAPAPAPAMIADQPHLLQQMESAGVDSIRPAHLGLIATLWQSWEGTFQAFCLMLRTEHRLPYGCTFIGNFLQAAGLRQRRPHTPVEAPWSSGTFRTLFPGAQWLGDGTGIAFRWGQEVFVFNLELIHDPASDALVGFDISDSEDEKTVRVAFNAGIGTTGSAPLSLSLDNRPSNHSPGVVEAVGDTVLLRSTPGRGQAKAPLEGAFGLFQQALPAMVVTGDTPREMARCAFILTFTAWCLGRNGKPRKRLKGQTPAEAYANACPTAEDIQKAMAWIRELERRRECACLTLEGRRDPVRVEVLTRGLVDLKIQDPGGRLAVALAGYARDAIVRGLAVFHSKQDLNTLPADVAPGPYLGGIIRQIHTQLEIERFKVHILAQRLRMRDLTLAPLQHAAERLRAEVESAALPQAFVDRALEASYEVDSRFWARAAAEALATLPAGQRDALYLPLGRRIAASFKTDRERRIDLVDRLAQAVAA